MVGISIRATKSRRTSLSPSVHYLTSLVMFDATIRDWICTLTHSDLRTARFLLQRYIELEQLAANSGTGAQGQTIQHALGLSKTALQLLGSGFKYRREDPDDPVQQALDAVDQYPPQNSSARRLLPDDRGRIESLAAATDTLKASTV
ncbi:hypothetical protein M407DRAFT_33494 [Tulasnella calospora MUT 4182]|uniref:Uncharacterized protein n=1 Tax=Tulasnella calospora MUT 4182 TaxID=1051891 RepID=A0A0C3Q2Y8_9AGAM|nr:hypothetical protein M407DRAFT_33494 [Tulasnella calospora MUT 4182]